jgi:ADP-heptose:LPS heptosyltransferase
MLLGPQPPPLGDVHDIALVRALALGDLLCAVPAFRSIRVRFPDARITLIGLPWSRELVRRFPRYLDEHLEFPGFPGIPEHPVDARDVVRGLAHLQARSFDLAIQLHGTGLVSNTFTALLGARTTAGFVPAAVPGLLPPADGVWLEYADDGTEVDRLLRLPVALGGVDDPRPELPLLDDDHVELAEALAGTAVQLEPGRYAVVHAGASEPRRRWPIVSFAAAADHLAGRGLAVVTTGTEGERVVTASLGAAMTAPVVDLAGRTSLGALALLVSRARLVLTNDTGVSHVAAGVRTPSVVIFSGSEPDRWAPLDRERHVPVGPVRSADGLTGPDVPSVIEALDVVLRRYPDEADRVTIAASRRPPAA